MKFTVHKLKLGDRVLAQIVEKLADAEFIVSFQGDLIRVRNESFVPLSINDKVLVRVVAVRPLGFQLVTEEDLKRGANRINVSI